MSELVTIEIRLDDACDERCILSIIKAISCRWDEYFDAAEFIAVLTPSQRLSINIESAEILLNDHFGNNQDRSKSNTLGFSNLDGVDFARLGSFALKFHFSPTSKIPALLWVQNLPDGKFLSFTIISKYCILEALPTDEHAQLFLSGTLPDDYEEMDIRWEDHFRPAWPENAKKLLGFVDLVKKFASSIKIPSCVADPDLFADTDLPHVMALQRNHG